MPVTYSLLTRAARLSNGFVHLAVAFAALACLAPAQAAIDLNARRTIPLTRREIDHGKLLERRATPVNAKHANYLADGLSIALDEATAEAVPAQARDQRRDSGRGEGSGGRTSGEAGGRSGRDAQPDMAIRAIEVIGEFRLSVKVANLGGAASQPCRLNAAIYAPNATGETFTWVGHRELSSLAAGAEIPLVFETLRPVYGQRVTAYVMQCQHTEGRGATQNDRLTLQLPARPTQQKPPADDPPPADTPKMSPDLAVISVSYEGEKIIGIIKNVGDRRYLAEGSNYKDSFSRTVTLTRIKRVGTQSISEKIESHEVPHVERNDTIRFAFKRPKSDPSSTHFRWQFSISGVDPDTSNNSFTTRWEKTPTTVVIDD